MSKHRGLPFQWWKNSDYWTIVVVGVGLGCVAAALLGAWFL